MDDIKFIYTSRTHGKGGQHTNGPEYGILHIKHLPTKTSIELDTYLTRGQHKARELGLTLIELILKELKYNGPHLS